MKTLARYFTDPTERLRLTGTLEGTSFLVLLGIAMPLKYMFDQPLMVKTVGMAHGILFMAYILLVIVTRDEVKWNRTQTLLAMIASVIPFGTMYVNRKMLPRKAKVTQEQA